MIYLDNSATTKFKPNCVIERVSRALAQGANPGRSGHAAALTAANDVLSAREKLCSFLDAKNCQCVFFSNCTQSLNQAIFGGVKSGHVITTMTEHNSVLRPLYALAREGRIRLSVLPPDTHGEICAEQIRAATRPDTVMVAVSAVSNVTGHAQTELNAIGAFCRVRDLLFLVDGAQGVGYLPLSVRRSCIDLLAVAPHKGLHAPMGVGALIVSERVNLSPVFLGGTGTDSRNPIQSGMIPEGLEAGTLPYPAICGLLAACEYLTPRLDQAGAHNLMLSDMMIKGLEARDVKTYSHKNSSGVVAFNLPNRPSADAADALNERGICVRGGLHCAPLMHDFLKTSPDGAVRASFSIDNTTDDVAATLLAIDEIVKEHP